MFKNLTAAVALLSFIVPSFAKSQTLSVYPVNVDISTSGGVGMGIIHIRNDDSTALPVQMSLEDFDQDSMGEHKFSVSGSSEHSCKERIKFFPESMVVEPGKEETITVEMLPEDAGCWSVLWVRNILPRLNAGASVGMRIGIKVYGIPATAKAEGKILGATVIKEGEKSYLMVRFVNEGTAVMRPVGVVDIASSGRKVLDQPVVLNSFSVLPGHVYQLKVPLPNLSPGIYTITPTFDYGGDYIMATRLQWVN